MRASVRRLFPPHGGSVGCSCSLLSLHLILLLQPLRMSVV